VYELYRSSNDVEDVIAQALVPTETPTATPVPEPTAIPNPPPTVAAVSTKVQPPENIGTSSIDAWDQFREGYRDAGGRPEWEDTLVCVVTKEAGTWIGHHGGNGYWSRAQFSHGDTWPKVQKFLISIGVTPNPDEPYVVGLGVGWWANQISHPRDTSGWRNTWKACNGG
jgi:hypothetical protein